MQLNDAVGPPFPHVAVILDHGYIRARRVGDSGRAQLGNRLRLVKREEADARPSSAHSLTGRIVRPVGDHDLGVLGARFERGQAISEIGQPIDGRDDDG